ncbi:hypothetical protein [Myxosarcina sp. GI1]|uniref:hypothetical protein n=1 Tax=Myxosarcina sp. GI1 TaxID=1541065 RepID=UPI00209F85DC|nr:hypothetical protein [Myxosarcina sp. GI1]
MTLLDKYDRQAIDRNFASVVSFLDSKFDKTYLRSSEVPSYFYKGNKFKLEVTVFANPRIAKIDIRVISLKSYDRESAFECSYNLNELSMDMFKSSINYLISTLN